MVVRLQHAAELLQENDASVCAAASPSNFKNASYFTMFQETIWMFALGVQLRGWGK